jgi:hypothetical protein
LYYLLANYEGATVSYEHKNNPLYDGLAVLRTSFDTIKRIKARNILELTAWAKHFEYSDLEVLRKYCRCFSIYRQTLSKISKDKIYSLKKILILI